MRNARLDEAQAEIKLARRNINNLRYTGDTTLMTESEEELKSLLMKVKEESGRGEAVTPGTVAHRAPLSVGFPRQQYWSELPFPSPGDPPNPGMGPESPALTRGFFTI